MLVYVQVEVTGSGSGTWNTIKFGGSGSGASMNDSQGMLRFVDAGFVLSDAVAAQFSFGGMISENNSASGLKAVNSKPQGWL
ncbi:MAG: hypothetical protein ACRDND_03770 [Streptosporangiaceae bacterium]